MRSTRLVLGLAVAGVFGGGVVAWAAPITPGNLVVYRVGTGDAALGTGATAVFLDEFTPAGAPVQSIPLPTTGASALTAVGNATTEGIISLSQDGSRLVFTGYRIDAGTTTGVTAATKVIGTVGLSGVADTSIGVTDVGAATIRSATTDDGSTYYASASNGVRYVGTPGGAATSSLIDTRNSRQVNLAGDVLYASNGSTTIAAKVQSYGASPTGTTAGTPVVTLATGDAVNGFFFADLSAGVAGVDTLYLNSTVEGRLRKYTFDGTSWAESGFLASTAQNVTGVVSGSAVTLYLTTAGAVQTLTDASGYNGALAGTITPIASAGTNTAFRGIGIVVPEPAGMMAVVGAAVVAGVRRRK